MSERYFPGEKVRITIDAEVSDHSGDELEYTYPTALGTVEAVAVLDCSPVKVERLAPAEWPPRPGDLWRDRDGDVWFCRTWAAEDKWRTGLVCARRVTGKSAILGGSLAAGQVQDRHGPLTLVHREDEQDGGRSDG